MALRRALWLYSQQAASSLRSSLRRRRSSATIFQLYLDGWGYKKIANYLTDTWRAHPAHVRAELRKEAGGEESRPHGESGLGYCHGAGHSGQRFLYRYAAAGQVHPCQNQRQGRQAGRAASTSSLNTTIRPSSTTAPLPPSAPCGKSAPPTNYRGVKINDNVYSGFLVCGDCGSPMFAMSRRAICARLHLRNLSPAGTVTGCTSHHIRVDKLDELMKAICRKGKGQLRQHAGAAQRRS